MGRFHQSGRIVFHTSMAFDTKLKQLALFMISW